MLFPELEMEVGMGGDARWRGLCNQRPGSGNHVGHTAAMACAAGAWGAGRGRNRIWQDRKIGSPRGHTHSLQVGPSSLIRPHPIMSVCVCALELPKIFLFPPPLISPVPAPPSSHLLHASPITISKIRSRQLFPCSLFPATLCFHLFLPFSS